MDKRQAGRRFYFRQVDRSIFQKVKTRGDRVVQKELLVSVSDAERRLVGEIRLIGSSELFIIGGMERD